MTSTNQLFYQIATVILPMLFILRFHLELSGFNAFIEPINTIRKITNPLVLPIKRLLPAGNWQKFAAIIVAFLIHFLASLSIYYVFLTQPQSPNPNILFFLINSIIATLLVWITFLRYGVFFFIIGTWIQISALSRINYLLYKIFDPILSPFRHLLPAFGGLDFSPILFFIGLMLVDNLLIQVSTPILKFLLTM